MTPMSLTPADAPPPSSAASGSEVAQAILRFLSGVRAIESVERLAYSGDSSQLDIWVLMRKEVLEDAERVFLLERAMRQRAGLLPINVSVIPLDQVDPENLPPAETVFERYWCRSSRSIGTRPSATGISRSSCSSSTPQTPRSLSGRSRQLFTARSTASKRT